MAQSSRQHIYQLLPTHQAPMSTSQTLPLKPPTPSLWTWVLPHLNGKARTKNGAGAKAKWKKSGWGTSTPLSRCLSCGHSQGALGLAPRPQAGHPSKSFTHFFFQSWFSARITAVVSTVIDCSLIKLIFIPESPAVRLRSRNGILSSRHSVRMYNPTARSRGHRGPLPSE